MTLTLKEARCAFTRALADLVIYATSISYELAFAEGMDRITEKDPTTDHMKGSNHEIGLAQDIDLYLNGIYMPATSDHEPLGTWWEDYGVQHGLPLVWGGNFSTPDGNHYSLRWQGKS